MLRPERSRRRRLAYISLLVALVLLGVSELAFRQARHHLDVEIRMRVNRSFVDGQTLRILCIGDSYTEGMLTASGLGWCDLLPEALQARGVLSRVQALNLGLSGSPTRTHLEMLRDNLEGQANPPDYVMLTTGANNYSAWALHQRYLAEAPRSASPLWVHAAYALPRSTIWGLEVLLRPLRLSSAQDAQHVSSRALYSYWFFDPAYRAYLQEYLETCIRSADAYLDARGIELLLGSYHFNAPYVPARRAAEGLSIPFFDLHRENPEAMFRREGYLTDDGWHPNDQGNAYIAGRWADWFLKDVWPEHSGVLPPTGGAQSGAPAGD